VPALAPAPAPAVSEPNPLPAEGHHSGLRTAGFAVGGAGILLVGLGAYFGAQAFSERNTASSDCGATFCTGPGNAATSAMKTDETLSTVGVIAGLAAVAAGVYFVLSSHGAGATARVSADAVVRGLRGQISW
jgi:hypothetical protein